MTVELEMPKASYSQLTTHRRCPQAWNYGYERGLIKDDPLDKKIEMWTGNWWHAVMAADSLRRGREHGSLKKVPRTIKTVDGGPTLDPAQVTAKSVIYLAEGWWEVLGRTEEGSDTQLAWVERIGQDLPGRLEYMYARWTEAWAAEREYEHPLAVELGWGRDLPASWSGEDPRTRLVGYVDEVYLDTKRNLIVCRDHKAQKDLDAQTTADDMMDSQLQLYAWGAALEIAGWGLGKVQATAYDRIKMVAPKPPPLTLSGRLAQREGKATVGSCDLHTYLEWATPGVPYPGVARGGKPGVYYPEEAIVERMSTPQFRASWLDRSLTPINSVLIKAHLRSAVDSALDVARTKARLEATGEAARNLFRNCRYCDFVQLCRAEMVGGPGLEYDLAEMKLALRPERV